MGDADELVRDDGKTLVTWRSNRDSVSTDWKALAMAMNPSEEMIAKFQTTKPGNRVFRIKRK